MADSNSNSFGIRVPKYNGKGGSHFTMFKMKFNAYLAEKKLAEILLGGFKATLPDAEDTILDEGKENEKKEMRTRELNTKGIYALIQALETPELMNKIMLEQMRDTKWPGGKFSDMWDAISRNSITSNSPTISGTKASATMKCFNLTTGCSGHIRIWAKTRFTLPPL